MKAKASEEVEQEEERDDAEMKESYVEPASDDHLDSLKSVIIEQQVTLVKNEEAWESLYLDLVTCITMLRSLENTQHVKA